MDLKISEVNRDGLQTRTGLDEVTVADYTETMREAHGGRFPFPPVVVYKDDAGVHRLADGFHRLEAAIRAGKKTIPAEIRRGGFVDALRCALVANARHGKRMTNADKQNALRMAWEHRSALWPREDGAEPSAGVLAAACGVSLRTAKSFLQELAPVQIAPVDEPQQPPQRPTRRVFGLDGRVLKMPTRPTRPTAAPVRPCFVDGNGVRHAVPLDRFGVEIPTAVGPAFADGAGELRQVLASISSARSAIRKEQEAGNPQFAAIRQQALVELDNAYNFVAAATPFCVCRMCQGQGCKACGGRGWQTEEQYDRNPSDFKAEEVQQ